MLIVHGSTIARALTVAATSCAIGERGERDVGARNAEDDERQQPVGAVDRRRAGNIAWGKSISTALARRPRR